VPRVLICNLIIIIQEKYFRSKIAAE